MYIHVYTNQTIQFAVHGGSAGPRLLPLAERPNLGHCWAMSARPLGPCCVIPLGPCWALPLGPCWSLPAKRIEAGLERSSDLVGWALVGPSGPLWAGLLWAPLGPHGPGPCGTPGPSWAGPLWLPMHNFREGWIAVKALLVLLGRFDIGAACPAPRCDSMRAINSSCEPF